MMHNEECVWKTFLSADVDKESTVILPFLVFEIHGKGCFCIEICSLFISGKAIYLF